MPWGNGRTARLIAVPSRIGEPAAERATPRDAAWLATIPCTLLLFVLVVKLGPPLGERLFAPATFPAFWPSTLNSGMLLPEPSEHARFLLTLLGPPLLIAGTALGAGRLPRTRATRALVGLSQVFAVAATFGFVVVQHVVVSGYHVAFRRVYFTWATLAVAALLAVATCVVVGRPALLARARTVVRETPARRVGAGVAAVLFTAAWLLAAFNTEGSIGTSNLALYVNIPFWLDESFAVLNGRAPLATFNAQYSQLWPYVGAGAMALFGASFTTYAAAMVAGTGAAMLAVYALLRRIVRRSLLALALFVPFVATSFFTEVGPLENRWGPLNSFSMFPMRYGGPYLLAWLTVRQLDGAPGERGSRRWLLFAAAWLVAINNVEFGIPAFAATVAAVLWTAGRPGWRLAARLLGELALGLAGAAFVVSALTLLVAGELPNPDPGGLFLFPRLYAVYGFGNLPISPAYGLHLTLYVTFVAAIAVATVRALEGDEDRPLTGALVWSGVFGLGAGAYFAGRSHPDVLIALFSPWALAVVLLAVAAARSMLARPSRLPSPAQFAPLLGVGIALCSIGQIPRPWAEVERIGSSTAAPAFRPLASEGFVAKRTRPHEWVAILGPLGHRIAYDVGIEDVLPYATLESIPTRELFGEMLADLRKEGVHKVFLIYVESTTADHEAALRDGGFVQTRTGGNVVEFVRRRG